MKITIMRYLLPLIFCTLSYFVPSLGNSSDGSPYCIQNITEIQYVAVNKTRQVEVKRAWYKKIGKPATKIEYYQSLEPMEKVIAKRICCEGYAMSDLQLCEPQCLEGCPANSKCVEPEVCKCNAGYYSALSAEDGKHHCQPICANRCPENSVCWKPNECACRKGYNLTASKECTPHCRHNCGDKGNCVAPNVCSCAQGYRSEEGNCVPECSLGDHCKNGKCVDTNKCECHMGFSYNEATHSCEANLAIYEGHTEATPQPQEETTIWLDGSEEAAVTAWSSEEEVDQSQTFEDSEESTTAWQGLDGEAIHRSLKCPDDFVVYRGRCQPLKFAIDEIDCRLEPCHDPRSHCMENGTCACEAGYRWYRQPMQADSTESPRILAKPKCISLKEYDSLVAQQSAAGQPPAASDAGKKDSKPSNFMSIFFIAMGVMVMTFALVYLGVRLLRRGRSQQMDVEGKQMACSYDKRGGSAVEPEKSNI